MDGFKDKVAVVTGSTRGIGKAIAHAFARAGANVVICGRDLKTAQNVANEIKKSGKARCVAFKCDVSKSGDVKGMIEAVVAEFGKIDILVNNAGVADIGSITELTEESWDRTINVDLKGVFLCSQAVSKHMIKRKYGKIVNIASIAGLVGFLGAPNYCAAKGGVVNLTKEMALELARFGINVNAIAPGIIETDMTKGILSDEKSRQAMLANIPLKRIGKPEDIANAAIFLASDDASYITGTTLIVDGGWTEQ